MNTEFPRMHVSLYVKDIAQTVNFYEKFFGQAAGKVKPGYAKFTLEKPSLIISFVENGEQSYPLFGHLGFQVETAAELETRFNAVKAEGWETLEEKGTSCCYALQDKFWVQDPDGYRWEIYQLHEDVEFNDPMYQTKAEACCSPAMATEPVKVEKEPCCDPANGCC